jgi:hypothetical protein
MSSIHPNSNPRPQNQPKGTPRECAYCGVTFYRRPSHTGPTCSHRCRGMLKRVPLAERFWNRVDKSGGPDACWPWQGFRNRDGYGTVGADKNIHEQRSLLTNRVAWALTKGPIPEGMSVLHSCDNPPCCNPRHLFLGTTQDNRLDQKLKGRVPSGTRHCRARFTQEQVDAIRARYAAGGTSQHALAREYGVAVMIINRLVRGLSYK